MERKAKTYIELPVPHLPAPRALAKEMTENSSPIANTVLRHMMWRMLGASHPIEAHRIDTKGIDELGVSPDAKEGIEAFLQKRPPEFPGKVSQDLPSFSLGGRSPVSIININREHRVLSLTAMDGGNAGFAGARQVVRSRFLRGLGKVT